MKTLELVRSPIFRTHITPSGHPESTERLIAIDRVLDQLDLIDTLSTVPLVTADESLLRKAHAVEMISFLLGKRRHEAMIDADTFACPDSVDVALLAAGTTARLAERIWSGETRRGFSLVRPPGHHATRESAMGFCLFNHLAISIAAVRQITPGARIAVIDFDLHHGNGTQDIFYSDPDVLFISSHRFPFYPGTGDTDETGSGSAKGTKFNFPIGARLGDEFFLPLYAGMVGQIVAEFCPEMIFVSAGFDGHERDPMCGFKITRDGYRSMIAEIVGLAERFCSGKVLFALEGGYHPESLAENISDAIALLSHSQVVVNRLTTLRETERHDLFRKEYAQYLPKLKG